MTCAAAVGSGLTAVRFVWCVQGMGAPYRSVMDCLRHMIQTEGLASFYRGAMVNAVKTVPGATIQFVAYDFIKTTVVLLDPTTGVSSPL